MSMLRGPIARATLRTSFVLGLRLVVQAGTLLLVARMLGPEQFGVFGGIAALAVLMGAFSTFGTHLVLIAEISRDPSLRHPILAYAVPCTLIMGSGLFILYLVTYWLCLSSTAVPLQVIFCIGLAETLLLPLFILPATEELALQKTARSQLLIILPLALRMVVAGFVMIVSPIQPLVLFSWLYFSTALLALGFMKIYKPKAWLNIRQWKLPSKQELKRSAGYATLTLTAMGPNELDKILAVKLLPLGISGVYTASARVIGATTLPVIALLLTVLPRLFRQAGQRNAHSRRLNRWIYLSVFAYGLVLAGVLWLVAPAVQWLFGSQYQGMVEMLRWLCLVVPGLVLRMTVANHLMTTDKPWLRASFEVFGMATLAITAFVLYEKIGSIGMALALVVSEWGMAALGFFLLKNHK